jgi:hypothetical protein
MTPIRCQLSITYLSVPFLALRLLFVDGNRATRHWYSTADIIEVVLCWEEQERTSRVGERKLRCEATRNVCLH